MSSKKINELESRRDKLDNKLSESSETARKALDLFIKSSAKYSEYINNLSDSEEVLKNASLTSYNTFMIQNSQLQLSSQQIIDVNLGLLNLYINNLNDSIKNQTNANIISSRRQRKLTRAIIFIGFISLLGMIITLLKTFEII